MAKRKGISKAKTSAKKVILENTSHTSVRSAAAGSAANSVAASTAASELNPDQSKDDSDGGGKPPRAMEIVQNHLQQTKNPTEEIKQQQQAKLPKITANLNETANFDDTKYLHKKFKRVANTTLNENSINSKNTATATTKVVDCTSSSSKVIDSNSPPKTNPSTHQQLPTTALSSSTTTTAATVRRKESPPPQSQQSRRAVFPHEEEVIRTYSNANYIPATQFHQPVDSVSYLSSVHVIKEEKHHLTNGYMSNNNNITHFHDHRKSELINGDVKDEPQYIHQNYRNNSSGIVYVTLASTQHTTSSSTVTTPVIKVEPSQYSNFVFNSSPNGLIKVSSLSSSSSSSSPPIDVQFSASTSPSLPIVTTLAQQQVGGINTLLSASSSSAASSAGRHVCPYCQLNCSKPSVLQKHIRAHTNERPYPCGPCGCAFKTKSNLYKHQRSRTHTLRTQGIEPTVDDEISLGSDQDQDQDINHHSSSVDSRTASPMMDGAERYSLQQQQQQQQQQHQHNHHTLSHHNQHHHHSHPQHNHPSNQQQYQHQLNQGATTNSNSSSSSMQEKPYKPKFHNVLNNVVNSGGERGGAGGINSNSGSLSTKEDVRVSVAPPPPPSPQTHQVSSLGKMSASIVQPNQINLAQHISKLIMENEQIVEGAKPLVSRGVKKFPSGARGSLAETAAAKLAATLERHREAQQIKEHNNKMMAGPSSAAGKSSSALLSNQTSPLLLPPPPPQQMAHSSAMIQNLSQPLNLTKNIVNEAADNPRKRSYSEGFSDRDVANHPQNPEKSIIKDLLLNSKNFGAISPSEADERFTCPFCKVSFRNGESLKYHTMCYCQGSQTNSPQTMSPAASPSHGYFRSNTINDKYSPNSLAKLASTSLRRYPKSPVNQPSTLLQLVKPHVKLTMEPQPSSTRNRMKLVENIVINPAGEGTSKNADLVYTPLPSPGPFLGKTRLVDSYSNEKSFDEVTIRIIPPVQDSQPRQSPAPATPSTAEHTFALPEEISPIRRSHSHHSNLQMFGGEVQVIDKKSENFVTYGSGGSVTSLSPTSQSESEPSPILIAPGYFSGGSGIQLPQMGKESGQKTPQTPRVSMTPTMTPNLTPIMGMMSPMTHFQFPPINSITDYSPLTLPPLQSEGQAQTIYHGGKMIPFVPGMPGPNTSSLQPKMDRQQMQQRVISPIRMKNAIPSPLSLPNNHQHHYLSGNLTPRRVSPTPPRLIPNIKVIEAAVTTVDPKKKLHPKNGMVENVWSPPKQPDPKKYQLTRKLESPRKLSVERPPEVRHFSYDNLIVAKPSVRIQSPPEVGTKQMAPLHIDVAAAATNAASALTPTTPNAAATTPVETSQKTKFLRPTSLPLKPGCFTQKKHHGITPTQNTMPLISPETPRPSKNCIQLYLNGHAYTYLGLKCSTKMTYCTLNRAQPVYIANRHKLSMYSEWRVHENFDPHWLGISPGEAIALYDSRHCHTKYAIAKIPTTNILVHSQTTIMTPFESTASFKSGQYPHHQVQQIQLPKPAPITETQVPITSPSVIATVPGGYESNEDYTYVRGRGRGRYVCSECGIRCKKPSMLKKHIRTHTDVRPYTCKMCSFSFKTKGNLTKHMKSKTHYKKCIELGLNPGPASQMIDDDESNETTDYDQTMMGGSSGRNSTIPGDSDSDTDSDGDDGETESSDTDESKSRLIEHEAARCLLSLSMTPPIAAITRQSPHPHSESPDPSNPLRRSCVITTYTSPKPEFNFLDHEKYYSNPHLHKPPIMEVTTAAAPIIVHKEQPIHEEPMPIDLTKPKDRIDMRTDQRRALLHRSNSMPVRPYSMESEAPASISDVVPTLDQAGILTSLVSIMDKFQPRAANNNLPVQIDESKLLQQYLTEKALQDSKMKQMQMIRSSQCGDNAVMVTTTTTTLAISTFATRTVESFMPSGERFAEIRSEVPLLQRAKSVVEEGVRCVPEPVHSHMPAQVAAPIFENKIPLDEVKDANVVSGMDTLAEIAASSVKLDIAPANTPSSSTAPSAPPPPPPPMLTTPSIAAPTINDSAKSVASEYLKITSNAAKRPLKPNAPVEDDEMSESDHDDGTGKMLSSSSSQMARSVVVGGNGFRNPTDISQSPFIPRYLEDGRLVCTLCSKHFKKEYLFLLHCNIHYIERKFRCEPCGISFRTKGHLQKHERSVQHDNKVSQTSTFGVATSSNPRPFKCADCKVAFRIHGHLAKHLRSKSHVMKLECIGKLPFGMYAEIERAGVSLTDIDTKDCDNSLASLLVLAKKLHEKDPTKFSNWQPPDPKSGDSSSGIQRDTTTDSEDSDGPMDEVNSMGHDAMNRDSAFSSDSSSGSIKRKIDAIAGRLDPILVAEENHDNKRLKSINEI